MKIAVTGGTGSWDRGVGPQANATLVAAAFPGATLRPGTGPHDTLISIDKARRLIGYDPEWIWRRVLGVQG